MAFTTVEPPGQALGLSGLYAEHQSPGHPEADFIILPPCQANPGSGPAREAALFGASSTLPLPCLHVPWFGVTNARPSQTPLLLGRPWVREQVPVTIDFQAAEVSFSSLSCSWDRPRHLAFISSLCSTLGSKF